MLERSLILRWVLPKSKLEAEPASLQEAFFQCNLDIFCDCKGSSHRLLRKVRFSGPQTNDHDTRVWILLHMRPFRHPSSDCSVDVENSREPCVEIIVQYSCQINSGGSYYSSVLLTSLLFLFFGVTFVLESHKKGWELYLL